MQKKKRKTLPDDYLGSIMEMPADDVAEGEGPPAWLEGIPVDYLAGLPQAGRETGETETSSEGVAAPEEPAREPEEPTVPPWGIASPEEPAREPEEPTVPPWGITAPEEAARPTGEAGKSRDGGASEDEPRRRRRAKRKKERMGFYLPPKLCRRIRRAARRLAGTGEPTTYSGLAEQALSRELKRLEKKYNGGKPFARGGRARKKGSGAPPRKPR